MAQSKSSVGQGLKFAVHRNSQSSLTESACILQKKKKKRQRDLQSWWRLTAVVAMTDGSRQRYLGVAKYK